ncbi:MAG: hypothetical protein ACXAC8_12320 [Candidatus Hodarchaeales archaeon]
MTSELKAMEVTPNIFMTATVTEETNQLIRPYLYSNITCIVLPEELIFVDSGPHPDVAERFRKEMENRFQRKTSCLILTSKAWDKIWGMRAFKDVNVISSSATKSGIRQNLKKGIDDSYREWILRQIPEDEKLRKSLMNNEIFGPTIGFSKKRILGPDSFPLELEVVLAGAIAIYSKTERTLLPGNIIQSFMPPFVWPITGVELYRKWERLNIQKIVSGRGPVVNKDYLTQLRKWMEAHIRKLREYRDQGVPERKIVEQIFPDHPGKERISWINGGPYHTGLVQRLTRYWYKQVLNEEHQTEDDEMFIS